VVGAVLVRVATAVGIAVHGPHGAVARLGDLHRLLRALFLCDPALNVFLVQYGATAPVGATFDRVTLRSRQREE
jgi:hypothetical protein